MALTERKRQVMNEEGKELVSHIEALAPLEVSIGQLFVEFLTVGGTSFGRVIPYLRGWNGAPTGRPPRLLQQLIPAATAWGSADALRLAAGSAPAYAPEWRSGMVEPLMSWAADSAR